MSGGEVAVLGDKLRRADVPLLAARACVDVGGVVARVRTARALREVAASAVPS